MRGETSSLVTVLELLLLLWLPQAAVRAVVFRLQRESLLLTRPIPQLLVGLLLDLFASLVLVSLALLLALVARAIGTSPAARRIAAGLAGGTAFLLLALVLANAVYVRFTGFNLSPYDFTWLPEAWSLRGSVFVPERAPLVVGLLVACLALAVLACLVARLALRLIPTLALTLPPRTGRPGWRPIAGLLALLLLTIGVRSLSISLKHNAAEPVESHPLTHLAWRLRLERTYRVSLSSAQRDRVATFLATLGAESAGDPARPFLATRDFGRESAVHLPPKTNVVLLVLESFGRSVFEAEPEAAPFVHSLRASSLWLDQHYTNHYRTAGAQLNLLDSQLEPLGFFVSRDFPRSRVIGLPQALREAGYATLFYTGSHASFDNNALWLRRNGFDEVVTGEAFPAESERVAWGVADTVVLEALSRALERCRSPFFAYFLSVTGHEGSLPPGYAAAHPDVARREPYFRALRYTDDALRAFFSANERQPWFRDTLFVLVGDHQPWDLPAARLIRPSALGRQREWFHVVALLRHPQLAPGVAPRDTSHVDIAPTILALLGRRAQTESIGSCVLAPSALTYIPGEWIQRDGRLFLHRQGEAIEWDSASGRCVVTDALTSAEPRPCEAAQATAARDFRASFLDVVQWEVLQGEH